MPTPNYRVEIQKHIGAETWANDYLINAASLSAANTLAARLVAFERALHRPQVTFDFVRVSTTLVGDRSFIHTPINLVGLNPNTGPDILLPLFNTLRVDLKTDGADPGRKYYRGVLLMGDLEADFTIAPSRMTGFNSIVTTNADRPSAVGVLTPKGNAVTGETVADIIQERQLHRKRRKKVTP